MDSNSMLPPEEIGIFLSHYRQLPGVKQDSFPGTIDSGKSQKSLERIESGPDFCMDIAWVI
jgi:hypothetical protein